MSELPRYSSSAECPKCGYSGVSTAYRSPTHAKGTESMSRKCGQCGYCWDEEPLDAESAQKGKKRINE